MKVEDAIKISEMIEKLETLKAEQGDLLVVEGNDWRCGSYYRDSNLDVKKVTLKDDGGYESYYDYDGGNSVMVVTVN